MQEKSRKLKTPVSSPAKKKVTAKVQFPIVGIGASAGGLEALELYLGQIPENSGMAYVIIQHLDPTQKGMLPELLQRITSMKVLQVKDNMRVKPNIVYVIPPNKSMSILHGVLHLFDPLETRGLRLPVDYFFRSLAEDRNEQSIGVILSGMGSDGSNGLREIKERNGIALVQDPVTAKFDSMPRNAIDSVLVDIIAAPNLLSSRLIEFITHSRLLQLDASIEIKDKSALEKIIILLRTYTGNDFSLYKKNTLYRRIERRMSIHKIVKISSYVNFLQENPKELDILFKELMIGVTSFFRDLAVWDRLKDTIIPELISNLQPGSILRAWIPGCSTGEEAYSLAIVFKEALEKSNSHGGFSLQIFATDLDHDAIEIARKGVFSTNIEADVSPARLSRFFLATDDGYFINTEIRETVVFAQHNIIMHPPFTKIDFLSCRNLLIYMEPELQKKLIRLFYYSLNPEGIMILGSSETLGTQSSLFQPLDSKLKIYRHSENAQPHELVDFPSKFLPIKQISHQKLSIPKPVLNIQSLADQLLLQQFSPAGVLVNEEGDIIYISGHTGKYLEPAVGKANMNIFAMLRDELRSEFVVAFRKAVMKKDNVLISNLKIGTNGNTQTIDINIQVLEKPEPLHGMVMIVFKDVTVSSKIITPGKKNKKAIYTLQQSELEDELKYTRGKMQDTLEEMQTSQEELKSTNEELQSTNEELQSTNEELTSSKEEMQSLNEELQTVNAELQSKVDEFSRVNNDMKNLLNSTDIATLFLDKELNIRRYTFQATKIFKLIKGDIGRPFTDQVSDLIYPDLSEDATDVLKTLVFIQKPIPTKDGRWFSVRIMPYRTLDDRIDGLVITFINISDLKKVEEKMVEVEQINKLLFDSTSEIAIKLSTDWNILVLNPAAEKYFGINHEAAVNKSFLKMFIPQAVQKKTESDLNKLLKVAHDTRCKIKVLAAGGIPVEIDCSFKMLLNNKKKVSGIIILFKK
jgi:two-component system CheB/CheR fusion protein